ncbi:MAG: hypothetical protein LC109_00275 [Bacteroidia bacterium]|nr:hypothetical protein [Bacteroidia bacterium]
MKKDTRFWLTTFFEEQEQTKHPYKSFKREIENNGCFKVKTETDTVKIYTPELAVIFTSKELPARNMDTKTETTINGRDYIETYIKGYKEGEQYFENEFKVSPTTLYGANAEQYVRDIHLNFFHIPHTGLNKGWSYVKKSYPMILTHKAVKEFGYYSGIVNKVEEQVKKYPRLFATFDKCEHNLPPQPIVKQKPEQETPKTFDELFYDIELVQPSIDILKEIEPPLIDTDYNYIGKLKGIICVWIDELQRQGIVKSNYPEERKLFASLIPQKIKRFSIDESMFGKYQSKAEELYRTDIKTRVSNIKLSQNSH